MWIWPFFILLIHQRADVCRASAVSPGRNHSTSICSSPCLLVLNSSDVIAFDLETSEIISVKSGLSRALTLDYHFSLGYIFWSDLIERSIKRFSIYNENMTTVIVNTGVCAGLAVEWRTSRLYWTDSTFKKISVSDIHGLNQHSLITELEEPRDIALDPDSGLMFWTDWGHGVDPKIMRASLNGSQILSVVMVNLQEPTGINLDFGNRRIFWVNSRTGIVESVNYDGGNRNVLSQQSGLQPSGLAFFPSFLFLTVWKAMKQVYQLDAITGKMLHSYSISDEKPIDIVPYDASRQAPAFNPCSVKNGGCSHFCVPKTSGYECVCSTGLPLKQDGKTCQNKVKKFVLFTDSEARSINMISLDVNYSIAQPLLNHLYDQRPTALGFDPVEDRLYWSDVEEGRIMSAFANGTSVKTLFSCNVLKPYGLAIDHVGRNIYWTDAGMNSIEVGRLDGTKRKLLFKDELEEPRAIVLDEKNGIMVWTAWGTKPHIARAQMDGSARQTLVTGNLSKPDGVIIDQATNRLYWSDAQLDTIEMSDLNGGHRQVILSSAAKIKPFRLAFYQKTLYWTDPNNKRIELYNLVDGKPKTVVRDVQKPTDIHVHDPSVLYSDSHPCDQNNGFCSDFCLLKPEGYQCACPTGIALKSDGKNCENDMFRSANSWMLLTELDSGEINNVSLSIPGNPCFPLKIKTNISRPVAVSYDPLEGKIYWADSSLKLVARAYPDGSSTDVVAYGNVGNPRGLAIDYTGRSLYWCDFGTNKIEVARLDGSFRTTLINSSIERPMAIILDIAGRKMYWSSWGKFPKIEQANMDGSARKVLVNSTLAYVNSFALDHSGGVLYWCDASLHRIERVDFHGNNRVVLLDLSFDNWNPYGLALSGNILYLSDWKKKAVYKYNMSSSVMKIMVQGMGTLMDLHVYNDKTSYKGSTSCSQLNGGCSHLCLPNPSGHRCFCPDGVYLQPHDRFTCQRVTTCGPLVPPVNAIISPPTCQSRSYFGQTCRISCRLPGYIVVGARSRVCGSNGKWTGSNNSRCKDITPPSFTTPCPKSMDFYTAECSSDALVSWDEPVASDNSGNVSVSYPEIRPPTRLSSSFNPLTYIATDSSGNCVNCSFHLRVIRKSCPALSRPINGNVNLSCGHWFGSEAVFSCNRRHQLNGSQRRFCDKDGVWSGFPSSCEREEDNNLTGETSNHLSDISLVLLVVSSVIPIVIMIYIYVRCGRSAKNRGVCGPIPIGNPIYEDFSVDPLDIVEFTVETNPPENQVGLNDSSEGDYLPDSFEKKKTFNSSGGELSATNDSDVKICIGKGAIPIGVSQEIFYRVVYDTTELLRDIPVGPDETIISPVIECGPHDIRLLKPLEIIIPHCLYMGKAKKEWITVYRTDPGPIKWEKIPSKSEKKNMSRVWFTVKEDSIHIKTMTFCFWCVYCRGAPRMKRATVFASKPNPRRDLIEFRFYIYSDNKEFSGRVKKQDEKQFPDSWQGIEKPFKMYSNSKKITVKLDPEEGWEFDKTPGEQVYICDDSHGGRSRCINTCTFAVKPVKGREVEEFSCNITFQQEGHDEHAIYVNPGFSLEEKLVEPANACTHFNSAAGCSTSSAPAESDRRSSDEQPKTPRGLNKSWSVNFPRQRYTESGGLEATSHTVRGSKSASGCSKSLTQEESDRGNLNEQSKTPQASKILSSLLDNRSFLKKVCDRLDREMKNYGDYRDVCSHYGFDRYEVAANFAKHDAGPSTALLEYLAVKYPKLTVDEFASVLKNVTQRNDVVESLEEYDNE